MHFSSHFVRDIRPKNQYFILKLSTSSLQPEDINLRRAGQNHFSVLHKIDNHLGTPWKIAWCWISDEELSLVSVVIMWQLFNALAPPQCIITVTGRCHVSDLQLVIQFGLQFFCKNDFSPFGRSFVAFSSEVCCFRGQTHAKNNSIIFLQPFCTWTHKKSERTSSQMKGPPPPYFWIETHLKAKITKAVQKITNKILITPGKV